MITIMKIKVWCRWMNENENEMKIHDVPKWVKLGLSPERCRQDAVLFGVLFYLLVVVCCIRKLY